MAPVTEPRDGLAAAGTVRRPRALAWALVIGAAALLVDAAVETSRSGSPLRWWVAGAVVAYVTTAAAAWHIQRRSGHPARPAAIAWSGGYLLLALVIATSWLPGGLERGVRLAGLSTPQVLAMFCAVAVALAGWLLFALAGGARASGRTRFAIRLLVTLVTAYAAIAFVLAVRDGISYPQLFNGQGFSRRLPVWLQGTVLGAIVLVPVALVAQSLRLGVRKLRRLQVRRIEVHQVVALAVSVAITLGGTWRPASPAEVRPLAADPAGIDLPTYRPAGTASATTRPYEEVAPLLDRIFEEIERLRAQIDRSQFDLAVRGTELGREAPALVSFVRDAIAFEQYPGVLRGAQGTLMSRAGNALDQSMLLAALLENAGHQARIARGTLTEDQAEVLVRQIASPRPPAPPLGNLEEIRRILVGLVALTGTGDPESSTLVDSVLTKPPIESNEMYRAAQADAEFILETLARERIALGKADAESALLREARDYFWVEYRHAPTDPWVAAHPAFAGDRSAPGVAATAFFSPGSVPRALQHRFRVRVVNERLVAGKLETYDAMAWWERPAADVIGVPLTYYNYPSGLSKPDALADLPSVFEKTSTFIPTFNDRPPSKGAGFDWSGEPYNVKLLASGQVEVMELGRTMGRAFGGLTRALEPLGSGRAPAAQPDSGTLTGQWIDYGLIAPGNRETIHRRAVLDRIGSAARAAGRFTLDARTMPEIGTALTRQHTFMLAPGHYPEAYVADRILERIVAARPALGAALRNLRKPDAEVAPPTQRRGETAWLGHLPIYAAFDSGASGGVTYRSEPSLVVYEQPLGLPRPVTVSLDIVHNTRRSFAAGGGRLLPAPESLLRTGVWETHAERLLPPDPLAVPGTVRRFDTMEAFRLAKAASIPVRVVGGNSVRTLADLSLPPDTLAAVGKDLASGYLVILPETLPRGSTMAGWWRIDPETGETLGMAADGRGAQLVQYLVGFDIVWNLALLAESCLSAAGSVCSCLLSGFFAAMSVAVPIFGAGRLTALAVGFGTGFTTFLGMVLSGAMCVG